MILVALVAVEVAAKSDLVVDEGDDIEAKSVAMSIFGDEKEAKQKARISCMLRILFTRSGI